MPRLPQGFRRRKSSGSIEVTKKVKVVVDGAPRWTTKRKSYPKNMPVAEIIRQGKLWRASIAPVREVRASDLNTFDRAATDWLEQKAPATRGENSCEDARSFLRIHVRPAIGRKRIEDLRAADLWTLRAVLNRKLAKSSVAWGMSTVRCVLVYSGAWDRLRERGMVPVAPRRPAKRLQPDQVTAILEAPLDPYDRDRIEISLGTGMRYQEMRTLPATAFSELPRPHLILGDVETKSGRIRRIPLSMRCEEIIRRRIAVGRRDTLFPGPGQGASIYLRVGKLVGFKFAWHQLRHTFACEYLEAGGSLAVLSAILGHSKIETTMIYATPDWAAVQREFDGVTVGVTGVRLRPRVEIQQLVKSETYERSETIW